MIAVAKSNLWSTNFDFVSTEAPNEALSMVKEINIAVIQNP